MLFQSNHVLKAAVQRRSVYHLKNKIPMSENTLIQLIKESVREAPTAFNEQAVRAVVLLNGHHTAFWKLLNHICHNIFSIKNFKNNYQPKIISFSHAFGTILFFTDKNVVQNYNNTINMFGLRSFINWSEQAQGNAQYLTWLVLAEHHIGASIHHYDAALDNSIETRHLKVDPHALQRTIKAKLHLPNSWDLRTEMVFGEIEERPGRKGMIPDSKRFRIFK